MGRKSSVKKGQVMVRHITMWKLRDFAWGNDKETNYELSKQQGLALKDKFPKLLHTEFHRGFKCGGQNYDMVNILEFATREDLEEFLASPLHQQAHAFNQEIRSERAVIDYEY